ncbi:MAG: UDP-N-acetylmuramate dehydrogenase [Alphaproteobacteria bacterium]
MTTAQPLQNLMNRLPDVRGRYTPFAPLDRVTWFQVGGVAEVLFRPADPEDLAFFLKARPRQVPITVIGVGSNLLVRDGGVPGVVLRLMKGFVDAKIEGDQVRVGAGMLDINLATVCRDAGLAGLEFFSGIPGTVGGALRMNAGAFGGETQEVIIEVTAVDAEGVLHKLNRADMGYSYRHCDIPDDWIFVSALLQGRYGDRTKIADRMKEIANTRAESQPIRTRTGGSTFKNPSGHKAWQLIDAAGCRGLRRGAAVVSEKHCNFLINEGRATASDIEGLGEEVRRRVMATSGISLEWEIKRIGVPSSDSLALANPATLGGMR